MAKHFTYPRSYMELREQGYLANPSDEIVTCWDFLAGGAYLWFDDMEWMSEDEIRGFNRELGQSKDIVPFAYTAGMDYWAWLPDDKGFAPIVFCPHDESEAFYYAPCFEGALFRHLLDFASSDEFTSDSHNLEYFNIIQTRRFLRLWLDIFRKSFQPSWIIEVERLLNVDFKRAQVRVSPSALDYLVLLTPGEKDAIVAQELSFGRLNDTFIWWK